MFKNYLKIVFRNLRKNKIYSVINIAGLAVGLACCILILLHVQDEVSYDDFHPNKDHLYRMVLERIYPDHVTEYANIPSGFSEAVKAELPEVKKATRLVGFPNFSSVVGYKDRVFDENYIFFADSNFFEVFPSFEIIRGNPDAALTNPNSVLLTESTARKYFGNENPIGKTIEIDNTDSEVAGVMQDLPRNSHIKFDFLASTTNVGFLQNPNYISFSSYTYLELAEGVTPEQVEAKLPGVVKKYASGQIERELGLSYEEYTAAGNGYNYYLQPIEEIHLTSNLEAEIKPNGSITYVYIFVSISLFILLIAGINFVNLATARSAERAKEVGIRKVMGSGRLQLIRQFLAESTVISLISLVVALALIQFVLPHFNNLAGKELELTMFGDQMILPLLLAFAVVVGILSGLYPAFYISSFQPVKVMKGKFNLNARESWLRNGLVVFQFAISIILISATLVIFDQMEYMQNRRLGFDKENVLVLERANSVDQLSALKDELRRLPGIVQVAGSSAIPGGQYFGMQFQQQGGADVLTTKALVADDYYFDTMGINIVEGRAFSENFNDSLSVILNQTAVKALGIENPAGTRLQSNVPVDNENRLVSFTVVGVAEDFNFESLRTEITPLAVVSAEGPLGFQTVVPIRLATRNFQESIAQIEEKWKAVAPDQPFSYTFLDNELAALYESERRSGKVFGTFAILAIIIACVGLFGLAAYMAFQRTKEIGVRKVLGATVSNIVLLLSKDFTKLIGIAFLFAAPVSYLLMNNWLEDFAFRIEPGVGTFLAAGLVTLLIAMVTVSYQAIRAATMNPVDSLRNE